MPGQKSQYPSSVQSQGYPPYSQQQQQRPVVPGSYPNMMMPPPGTQLPPGYSYPPPTSGQYGQIPQTGYPGMGYYYPPPTYDSTIAQQQTDKNF